MTRIDATESPHHEQLARSVGPARLDIAYESARCWPR